MSIFPGAPSAKVVEEEYTLAEASEDEAVVAWRVECLRLLGVSEALAEVAAESSVDWHTVDALVARGCEPNVAVGIAL